MATTFEWLVGSKVILSVANWLAELLKKIGSRGASAFANPTMRSLALNLEMGSERLTPRTAAVWRPTWWRLPCGWPSAWLADKLQGLTN